MGKNEIEGRCHCGAVSFRYFGQQERLVSCNCSICRRLGVLWAHDQSTKIDLDISPDRTVNYVWGDKQLVFCTCATCGSTICWVPTDADSSDRMAVNMALAEPQDIAHIPVRRFDGADTWQFID